MLIKEIQYEDFDGNPVVGEKFHFNLTKSELVDLETSYSGGLEETIRKIAAANDVNTLMREFKRIILMAYGVRSDDGKVFRKSKELSDDFSNHAAFDVLFMQLIQDDKAAAEFIQAILPKDVVDEALALMAESNNAPKASTPAPFPAPKVND